MPKFTCASLVFIMYVCILWNVLSQKGRNKIAIIILRVTNQIVIRVKAIHHLIYAMYFMHFFCMQTRWSLLLNCPLSPRIHILSLYCDIRGAPAKVTVVVASYTGLYRLWKFVQWMMILTVTYHSFIVAQLPLTIHPFACRSNDSWKWSNT